MFSPPTPRFVKESCLLRNGWPEALWIETGTFEGETTEFLAKYFPMVFTIEPDRELYNLACRRFVNNPKVKIINGFSEQIFPSLLPTVVGTVNFWLDGHYSGGKTSRGPKETPIDDELDCIAKLIENFSKISIMVDDVRCFSKDSSSYPPLLKLVNWAEERQMHWHIEHDIFVARRS